MLRPVPHIHPAKAIDSGCVFQGNLTIDSARKSTSCSSVPPHTPEIRGASNLRIPHPLTASQILKWGDALLRVGSLQCLVRYSTNHNHMISHWWYFLTLISEHAYHRIKQGKLAPIAKKRTVSILFKQKFLVHDPHTNRKLLYIGKEIVVLSWLHS